MMTDSGIIVLIIIVTTIIFSYKGFINEAFFDGYKFEVDRILINRDYLRLVTSGFLHVSWLHLVFNMLALYAFSGPVELILGGEKFAIIYFASLIGGDLLSLLVHRNHGDYSSVGASGAVCGVIFASIALFPGMDIGFFGLPFAIPSWLYGVLYVLYAIYGIRSKKQNIGHEAHLGGALVGMIIALIVRPSALLENYLTILLIAIPTISFIYLIITKPHVLLIDNFYFKTHTNYLTVDHKYNAEKSNSQREIDRILDKISKRGINSLNAKEKDKLKQYSQKMR